MAFMYFTKLGAVLLFTAHVLARTGKYNFSHLLNYMVASGEMIPTGHNVAKLWALDEVDADVIRDPLMMSGDTLSKFEGKE